jgi:hypothetical protein
MGKGTVKTEGCRLLLDVSQFVGVYKKSINSYWDHLSELKQKFE